MEFSYLIVTHDRVTDLTKTLEIIRQNIDLLNEEVLVYIDACEATEYLRVHYPWVRWFSGKTRISASPARAFLYPKAMGTYLIGLDDDAHIITSNYKELLRELFADQKVGVLAFKEVRGLFKNDAEALEKVSDFEKNHETNDFIGCGFAIKKTVYDATRGFPTWIDIYGEEPCMSFEVMELGYELWFTNTIAVNHRIDIEQRKLQGKNYFRFEKQLENSFFIFLNYYPKPFWPILKLLHHNFKKYALHDFVYFKTYFRTLKNIIFSYSSKKKYRQPISKATLQKNRALQSLVY
ncbi:glycosyltransferase family 2 protein [Flavobacterium sp. RSSA_27]|uniref:glycosyltransferase family 2 protein n=1 Tax=Flavobacterium sp. RSSA_27 TaxID=3447667 RepID=UPI003F2FB8AB